MSAQDDPKLSASHADELESTSSASDSDTTADVSGEDAEPIVSPEEELATVRQLSAENYERFVRARADLENIRKRHQRELEERARYDGEMLARDILQTVDDLERALEHSAEGGQEAVSGGVELVLKGLLAALKRNGVERIDAQGKPFDPAEHEAVTMVETAEIEPNTVVAVFRNGYKLRDRLLRAAMVSVAKAPAAAAAKS